MKKLIVFMLAMTMILNVAACGSTDSETKATTTKEQTKEIQTEATTVNTTEQTLSEEETINETDVPYNKVNDWDLYWSTECAHIDTDIIRLGNDEKATIEITVSPAGLSEEDVVFDYDEEMLSCDLMIESNTGTDKTIFTYTISAIQPGTSDIIACSSYDLYVMGEKAPVTILSVKGLDSEEGQIVYVTETGEKYHFSADCAGENAYPTTLYDAESFEYGPCGTCVQ